MSKEMSLSKPAEILVDLDFHTHSRRNRADQKIEGGKDTHAGTERETETET
jgi:hypothetical protein